MSDEKQMPPTKPTLDRRETVYKLVSWSTVAFLLLAGWFIHPSSTSHFYEEEGPDGRLEVHEVDLVSFCPAGNASTAVTGDAKRRAWCLTVGMILGTAAWWMAFWFICQSDRFPGGEKLEFHEYKPLVVFATVGALAFVGLWIAVVF